jgi:hypothetical protein
MFCLFAYSMMGVSVDQNQSPVQIAFSSAARTANWKPLYIISGPGRRSTQKILTLPALLKKEFSSFQDDIKRTHISHLFHAFMGYIAQ